MIFAKLTVVAVWRKDYNFEGSIRSRENREEAAAIVQVGEDEGWTRARAWDEGEG